MVRGVPGFILTNNNEINPCVWGGGNFLRVTLYLFKKENIYDGIFELLPISNNNNIIISSHILYEFSVCRPC